MSQSVVGGGGARLKPHQTAKLAVLVCFLGIATLLSVGVQAVLFVTWAFLELTGEKRKPVCLLPRMSEKNTGLWWFLILICQEMGRLMVSLPNLFRDAEAWS